MRFRRLIAVAVAGLLGVTVWGTVLAFGGGGSPVVPHFAVLNGGNEVGSAGEAGVGDLNGHGGATVVVHSNKRICFAVAFSKIGKVVAAHIHRGPAGANGPVVVDFADAIPSAGVSGNPGAFSGCVNVPAKTGRAIKNNPGNWYVNVHTDQFPPGAIRGQLG